MAKIDELRSFAQGMAEEVSRSPRDWMGYLDTAARLYRYSFNDNLLIYAQRPDATACAELEQWNDRMRRWVNRGAKGIALLDDSGVRTRVRYVFDVSDTHMVNGGRTPFLWQMEERHQDVIAEHLTDIYGLDLEGNQNLASALMAIATQITEENLDEMMDGIGYEIEDTFLEGMEKEYIRMSCRDQITNSAFYTMARRCGLNPMEYLEETDFRGITDFNKMSVLSFVGNATSDISEQVLREIGKTMRRIYVEELKQEASQQITETMQKGIENNSSIPYNEFNALKRESEEKELGGSEDGRIDISSEGRLSVSKPESGGRTSDNREVWNASQDISEREQEELVSEHGNDWEVEQTSPGDRGDGTEPNGNSDGRIAEDLSGTGQEAEPDGMGGTHEQSDSDGRGVRLEGIGVQLTDEVTEQTLSEAEEEIASALSLPEFPTANEQIRKIEERIAAEYAGEITIPTEVVDEILRTGGNKRGSQLRLIYNYMSEQTPEEYTEFLRKEYGVGGKGLVIGNQEYSVWFDELGMQIAVGHTVHDKLLDKAFLSWEDVSTRVKQLLDQGEYAPQVVLDAARRNALKEHADALIFMERDMAEGIAEIVFENTEIFQGGFPDKTGKVMEFLDNPENLADIVERISALAEIYEEDKSVMRFNFYKPPKVLAQFEKLQKEVIPYQARENFAWNEHDMFVTQDEIDTYIAKGGSYSDGRLHIYECYMQGHDEAEWTAHVRDSYGIGGSSHALSGADHTDANYDGKGLKLERRNPEGKSFEVLLPWKKVAKRTEYLIKNDKFLTVKDYARMPDYERGRMRDKVISFYNRLPSDIVRPYHEEGGYEADREAILEILSDYDSAIDMIGQMDEALAMLPLDFEDYQAKVEHLSILHQYIEGTYTIFPQREESDIEVPESKQMSLFDYMGGTSFEEADTVEVEVKHQTQEVIESVEPQEIVEDTDIEPLDIVEDITTEPQERIEDINETPQDIVENVEKVVETEQNVDIQPAIQIEPTNFHITDDELGVGGPKEKFRANMEAIVLLKAIEADNRLATKDEQEILSRYVGWGGIPQAFDENAENWKNEYTQLSFALSPEEYREARSSTLNAFYTPPIVIKAMYEALENMGLSQGNMLEPSCGVGNFMGLMPESMNDIIDCEEDEDASSDCICGKEHLKYLFTIRNKVTQKVLYPIGSSCIQKFHRDDMDDVVKVKENMYKLYHAIERKEHIEMNSKYFSKKMLYYLYELGTFEGNCYNGFSGENDYYFLLNMFNKKDKNTITPRQRRKVNCLIAYSIKPVLDDVLRMNYRYN